MPRYGESKPVSWVSERYGRGRFCVVVLECTQMDMECAKKVFKKQI